MTGTPLQNNLLELLSLLNFIMPNLFHTDMKSLTQVFTFKTNVGSSNSNFLSNQRIQTAKAIMAPFVLRRRKDQVVKELPSKIISIHRCDPTEYQHKIYQVYLHVSFFHLTSN